jgi:hypothetical protein
MTYIVHVDYIGPSVLTEVINGSPRGGRLGWLANDESNPGNLTDLVDKA